MIIFDTTKNYNNGIKGILHMNVSDIEYLLTKYENKTLEAEIVSDYLSYMRETLKESQAENYYGKNFYDNPAYYRRITLGIETDEDEKLLKLLKSEVERGNIYTRKMLKNKEDIELRIIISKIELKKEEELTPEEIYILRSAYMSLYIMEEIKKANEILPIAQELYDNRGYKAQAEYKTIHDNLVIIGCSTEINESDYFDTDKVKTKKYEKTPKN